MTFLKLMRVKGRSMFPYLKENQLVLVSSIPFLFHKISVGDIVVANDPRDKKKIIKRVKEVNNNKYFIQGDNILYSTDSREFGFIARDEILSKLIIRITF